MKIKLLLCLLVLHPCISFSQKSLTNSVLEGTWRVVAVDVEQLFSYNIETKLFIPSDRMKVALDKDASGELKKSIAEIKKSLDTELTEGYVVLKSDKSFVHNLYEIEALTTGTYTVFSPITVPTLTMSENAFLQFVKNYGYEGGLKLEVTNPRSSAWANAKFNNDIISLTFTDQKLNIGSDALPASYTLKKASKTEADLIKQTAAKKAESQVKAEKEKMIQKEKADEEKGGKLYTTADKEPYYSGESENNKKIIMSLYTVASDNGALPGKYTVTVLYTVNKDGTVNDITVPTDPGSGLKNEIIRLIKRLPVMSPAQVNGEKVRFRVKKEFKLAIVDED
jgi:hypothetical protein